LAVALLSAVGGLYVHAQVSDDPISLEGLGEALLFVVRAWVTCLPFIIATLFWAVLARRSGPAMGVGIGLHFFEFLNGFVLALMAVALAGASDAQVPLFWRGQMRLLSVTLGHNADVFLYWGSPFMKAFSTATVEQKALLASASTLDGGALLPTTPWRAVAFLAGYAILFLGWATWALRRRDVTYGT
jgi:ABC-type transport system involved in multi-copper enzyme maturation permease subunit